MTLALALVACPRGPTCHDDEGWVVPCTPTPTPGFTPTPMQYEPCYRYGELGPIVWDPCVEEPICANAPWCTGRTASAQALLRGTLDLGYAWPSMAMKMPMEAIGDLDGAGLPEIILPAAQGRCGFAAPVGFWIFRGEDLAIPGDHDCSEAWASIALPDISAQAQLESIFSYRAEVVRTHSFPSGKALAISTTFRSFHPEFPDIRGLIDLDRLQPGAFIESFDLTFDYHPYSGASALLPMGDLDGDGNEEVCIVNHPGGTQQLTNWDIRVASVTPDRAQDGVLTTSETYPRPFFGVRTNRSAPLPKLQTEDGSELLWYCGSESLHPEIYPDVPDTEYCAVFPPQDLSLPQEDWKILAVPTEDWPYPHEMDLLRWFNQFDLWPAGASGQDLLMFGGSPNAVMRAWTKKDGELGATHTGGVLSFFSHRLGSDTVQPLGAFLGVSDGAHLGEASAVARGPGGDFIMVASTQMLDWLEFSRLPWNPGFFVIHRIPQAGTEPSINADAFVYWDMMDRLNFGSGGGAQIIRASTLPDLDGDGWEEIGLCSLAILPGKPDESNTNTWFIFSGKELRTLAGD